MRKFTLTSFAALQCTANLTHAKTLYRNIYVVLTSKRETDTAVDARQQVLEATSDTEREHGGHIWRQCAVRVRCPDGKRTVHCHQDVKRQVAILSSSTAAAPIFHWTMRTSCIQTRTLVRYDRSRYCNHQTTINHTNSHAR